MLNMTGGPRLLRAILGVFTKGAKTPPHQGEPGHGPLTWHVDPTIANPHNCQRIGFHSPGLCSFPELEMVKVDAVGYQGEHTGRAKLIHDHEEGNEQQHAQTGAICRACQTERHWS